MFLSKLRIKNYKSFRDSGDLLFEPGLNVVIGPNNSGKTALLESLLLKVRNQPHRSERLLPTRLSFLAEPVSELEFSVIIERDVLREYLNDFVAIPWPSDGRLDVATNCFNSALESSLTVSGTSAPDLEPRSISLGLYGQAPSNQKLLLVQRVGELTYKVADQGLAQPQGIALRLITDFVQRVYRFGAERFIAYKYRVGHASDLDPSAQNLAEVLQLLNTKNPSRFERFNALVSEVFPDIKWVSASMIDASTLEIRVWPIDVDSERDDLTISLSECGSGIGQALSILYVVISSERRRTILIDEPNSFLHPGAAREIIRDTEAIRPAPIHHFNSLAGDLSRRRSIYNHRSPAEGERDGC